MKAFPHEEWLDSTDPKVLNPIRHPGMDLRDYFAAKIMQGILANSNIQNLSNEKLATESYELADAMMEARNGD
jgi:hypothetical protein